MVNPLNALVKRFIGEKDSDKAFVAKQAGGYYFVRITYKAINFASAIFLARLMGQAEYGNYVLAWSWSALMITIGLFGRGEPTMREVTKYYVDKNWGALKGVMHWAYSTGVATSLIVMLVMAATSIIIYQGNADMQSIFVIAALLIPLTVILRIQQSVNDALKNTTQSRVPDMVIQPLIFIAALALVWLLFPQQINAALTMGLYVLTTLIFSLIPTEWLTRRAMPAQTHSAAIEHPDHKALNKSAFTFLLISALFFANYRTSTLMIGAFLPSEEIAKYGVMTRLVDLLTFIVSSISIPVARVAAKHYFEKNLFKLQRILTKAVRLMVIVGLPLALVMIALGKWYLLIFGKEYLPGYPALIVLILSEAINLITGVGAQLLVITKYENTIFKIALASLGINLTLGLLLIPQWGLIGGALSEMLSACFRVIAVSITVTRLLGANPTIFAALPIRHSKVLTENTEKH